VEELAHAEGRDQAVARQRGAGGNRAECDLLPLPVLIVRHVYREFTDRFARFRLNVAQPATFSLILGAELQPGLWATCTPSLAVRNQRISVSPARASPEG
jgi:hypothetical protein